ncbi:MAG: XrtA-associated tyrosine autokinase [Betaproteobacteria bacterium]
MSLIERAAKRLEELRRAGVELPPSGLEDIPAQLPAHPAPPARIPAASGAAPRTAPTNSRTGATSTQNRFDLDLTRLASLGFVTPDQPRSRIADEFRILKRPLIANTSERRAVPIKHSNLIMVTSSIPGEGKTFSAVNLALSLAMERDRTVLLVDADVARPSLPALLGMPPLRGLLDVLEHNDVDLSQVLLRTNVDKLSILPSGTQNSHATELLASGAMAQLLEEMAARYSDRIIVFDSPPLLVTTEARVLATQMGQIVFVVHAESTLQSDVKRALATIEACPIKMMVLNQARTVGQGAQGYGYGYGYGS